MFILYLLVFFIFIPVDLAWAEVEDDIKYTYYLVKLTTEDTSPQVLRTMIKAMPRNVGDSRRLAQAETSFNYSYRYTRSFEKCRIKDVRVKSSCTMMLPDFKGGGEKIKYRLAPIVKYVEDHELNHCRINTEHATKLESSLLKLGRVDCVELADRAKAEHLRVWTESRRAQQSFDKYEAARDAGASEWLHFNYFSETHAKSPSLAPKDLGNLNDNMGSSGIRRNKDGSWSNY